VDPLVNQREGAGAEGRRTLGEGLVVRERPGGAQSTIPARHWLRWRIVGIEHGGGGELGGGERIVRVHDGVDVELSGGEGEGDKAHDDEL
jgi:hypothetical protein